MANNVERQVWVYEAHLYRHGKMTDGTGERELEIRSTCPQAATAKAYAEASRELLTPARTSQNVNGNGQVYYSPIAGMSIAVTSIRHVGSASDLVRRRARSAETASV